MTVASVTSQPEVGEDDLYALTAVRLERVVADDVRRVVAGVVGRVERAAAAAAAAGLTVLTAVHRPTALCRRTYTTIGFRYRASLLRTTRTQTVSEYTHSS